MHDFDIFGGLVDAAKLGYNLYTNKRDFDYQKALQQKIFEREDTAIQRRMADLQAAGLNPNLAAGSAAGAGAVVSRSNTNDLGSALDTVQALNSIKLQKQQVENAKEEFKILNQDLTKKYNENLYSKAELYKMLGIPFGFIQTDNGNGESGINFVLDSNNDNKLFRNTPLENMIDYQLLNLKNSADILQKDNDYYTADKITGYLSSLLPNIGFSFGKRFK